jgi:hypothetical protein
VTGIIRLAFQEPDHANLEHPDMVQAARPPVRRSRRDLHLFLSHLEPTRLRLRQHRRLITACSAGPAAWTIAMIALSVAVRY